MIIERISEILWERLLKNLSTISGASVYYKDKDEERGRTNFVGTGALLYIDETRNLGKYKHSELEPKLSRFAGL